MIFLSLLAAAISAAQPLPLSYEETLLKTGSVTLPVGSWSIAAPLNPGLNGTIVGYGCTLVPAGGYAGAAIDANSPGVQVVGVTIQGFSIGIWMHGASTDQSRTAFIKDCEIDDYAGGYGIKWDKPSDGRIENVTCAQRIGTDGLPWVDGRIGISANTALASIYLGADAGGSVVSDIHSWGNASYDIQDFAPDSTLNNCRMESGRIAHLELAAWRIKVNGGTIWYAVTPGWPSYGLQIGDMANIDARYCVIDGLAMGLTSGGNMTAYVNVLHGSYNYFRLFRRRADPVPLSAGSGDSSSTYNWVTVP